MGRTPGPQPTPASTGKIVVPDGSLGKVSPLMPRGYVDAIEASKAGLPATLLITGRNNIATRIGLAYRLWGNNTVFRARISSAPGCAGR